MTTYERLLIVIAVVVVGTGGWWVATHPDITAQLAPRFPVTRVAQHAPTVRYQPFKPAQGRPSTIDCAITAGHRDEG